MKKIKETERIKVHFVAQKVYVDAYTIFSDTPEYAIKRIQEILSIAKVEYPDAIKFWFKDDGWGDDFRPALYGERYENDKEYALRMQALVDAKKVKKEKDRLKLEEEQKEYERLKAKFEKKS